jgi:hypothetical protein
MRRALRELVIFGLIGAFLAAVGAFAYQYHDERQLRKPYVPPQTLKLDTPPPTLDFSKAQPIPPDARSVPSCVEGFNHGGCFAPVCITNPGMYPCLIADANQMKTVSAEPWVKYSNSKSELVPLIDSGNSMPWATMIFVSAYCGIIGLGIGIGVWILYRLVLFAVRG